jgi:hypothetical protein
MEILLFAIVSALAVAMVFFVARVRSTALESARCPACGEVVSKDSKVCPNCGEAL